MNKTDLDGLKIAVLIPCYNEHKTIVKVINDFRQELPGADIYVFDNNSTDGSYKLAQTAGATVIKEKKQGKGFVVKAMLQKIWADIYIMVDGDDTYPASSVHDLIQPLLDEKADMVVGQRLSNYEKKAFRPLHYTGNQLVCNLINFIFKSKLRDPMSGYRAFTQDVIIELPVTAGGFDVETELTIQLLYRKFVIHEIPINYRERPQGSVSKLNTFHDGLLVIIKILSIVRSYKPLTFFGGIGIILVFLGFLMGISVFQEYVTLKFVNSFINVIFSISFIVAGVLSAAIGIIINTLNFRILELSNQISRQSYLDRNHHN